MENTPTPSTPTPTSTAPTPPNKTPTFGPIRPGFVIALLAALAVAGVLTLKQKCSYKKISVQTVELHLEVASTVRMQAIGGKLQSLQVVQEKPSLTGKPSCKKAYPPARQCPDTCGKEDPRSTPSLPSPNAKK
jgi:hypothetical protein